MYIQLHIESEAVQLKSWLTQYIESGVNSFAKKYIGELDKLVLIITGFEKFIRDLDTKRALSEFKAVKKLLRVFKPLNRLYKGFKPEDGIAYQIKERLVLIVDQLEEMEATLEILSDEKLAKEFNEALQDLEQGNKEAFTEWTPNP